MGQIRKRRDRRSTALWLALALALTLVPTTPMPASAQEEPPPLTVNSTGDDPDLEPGDGFCMTAAETCTLRAAIEEANALEGADAILFNIGGEGPQVIQPGSALPQITEQVTIDGTTQPGYDTAPLIVLDGSGIDGSASGLLLGANPELGTASSGSVIVALEVRSFSQDGIQILSSSVENRILQNRIHDNAQYGIFFSSSETASTGGNQILDNYIGTSDGTTPSPNLHGIFVTGPDNRLEGNIISGNGSVDSGVGVFISGASATRNVVMSNHIGTDFTGGVALGNGTDGILIQAGATGNFIGTDAEGQVGANVISANTSGITISGASGNTISNNLIGTDSSGVLDLGNNGTGIRILSADNNVMVSNVISGNQGYGVLMEDGGLNVLDSNFIGIKGRGDVAAPNRLDGVRIVDGPDNTLTDNVISGNGGEGIRIEGANASNNQVRNNYVGTDAGGSTDVGNTASGIYIRRAPQNQVVANVVSGNDGFAGIAICGNPNGFCGGGNHLGADQSSDAADNIVQQNLVGTHADGAGALGNSQRGVSIDGAPSTSVSGNTIANSGQAGVQIFGDEAVGNRVFQNSIHSNGGLGIDLKGDGVTLNDTGDGDTGPNELQNFPVVTSAVSDDTSTTIEATLDSAPSSTYTVEFFVSDSCDPSGHGEGATFLGGSEVTTDSTGQATVSMTRSPALATGAQVTATATDANGNTSEFSECVAIEASPETSGDVLYGVDSSSDSLSVIDQATGDVTLVGPLDPDPNIYVTPIAMGVHPTTGDLYVWNNSNIGESTGVLLIADRCTGLASPVDPETGPQGSLGALAFASDGSLYGLDFDLHQIDPTTGIRTQIGAFGGVRIGAADFGPDGVLYGVELAVGPERLFTINTSTGALTPVGTLSPDLGTIGSIVFAPDGTLLGSAGNELFEIDPGTAAVSGSVSLTASAPQGMGFSAPCEPAGTVVVDSMSVDDTTLEAGYAVPLAEIPPERLVFGATTIAGAPMGAIDLNASPMGAIPMAAIPMAAIGGTGSLGQTLLSEIPIEGGWEPLLAGTPYEGRPLQTLTLDEVAGEIDPVVLAELNLSSVRLGNTGLSDLSIASLMLGDVPLDSMCDGCPPESALEIETSGGSLAAVPMGAIPMAAIPMGAIGDLKSAPMGAIPMAAIPMGAIPMGAIGDIQANPLGAIPMGAIANLAALPMAAIDVTGIPMGAIPMAAIPMGAIPMAAIPMGAIPIGAIGGGCNGLVDCSFPGVDDFSTVDEYLVATGSSDIASSPMAAIPMGAIPMGAIPMGAIPMAAIPMAAIPMAAIDGTTPLGYLSLGDVPLEGTDTVSDICTVLADPTGCDGETLLWEYASALLLEGHENLGSTPMAAIELGALPMAAIPMAAIDLDAAQIAGVPMAAIEFDSIDLVNSPMGAIPMAAISSCEPATSDLTVLQAAALGELCDGTTLGDVDPDVLGEFELGDVLNYLTLGFLSQLLEIESQLPEDAKTAFGGLTYGEIVVSILLAIDFPWEELPLDQIETRDVACGFDAMSRTCGQFDDAADLGEPDIVDVSVDFTVNGGPVVGEVVEVTIPGGWGYIPGSAALTETEDIVINEVGSPSSIADPRDGGDGVLTFVVPVIDPGTYTLQFVLAPGFELGGAFQISASEIGGEAPVSLASPISVVEGLEFGDLIGSAVDLEADHLYVGYINRTGDQDWWTVGAPDPGFRVAVYLSNLAGDVDTFVYRPATAPLGNDASERDIPLAIQPFDDDDVFLGGGSSLSPELLADSPLNLPGGTVLGDASANRGADNEFAEFNSRSGDVGDEYTIQVAGFQGATSESPYVLRVRYREEVPTPECTARTGLGPVGGTAPAIPANVDTIFLANWDRMTALYPDADVSALRTQLDNLANSTFGGVHVNGVVVPIGSIPGVTTAFAEWDTNPCDPTLANKVADHVVSFVQDVAASHPTLRHVAIIGGDEQIPFVRLEDEAIVANESTYTEGFDDNALYGAHFTRHYLSDSPYGDLDPIPWLGRFAYIRDLGVGRLVESPADIAGALTTFTDNGGVLDPQTAATAGYDFLTDGAQEVKSGLSGLTDLDPGDTLLTESWTRQQLVDTAYGASAGVAADVISPNAHYDHYRSLPAIGNLTQTESDLFTIDDVDPLTASDLERRIIFTVGCHSGLSVDDTAGGTINQPEDWAQVYGERRAVYIGNTGYGYGDTATVALSEQMMANVAAGLGNGHTIGQNLSQAGQDQFGKAGLYGVYDLKAIEEATLYGLPMWRVNVSGASPVTGNGSETGPVLPDSQTGLLSASFSKSPTFAQESAPQNADGTSDGTYFTADGGTQFMQWRPITPKTEVNATQDGLVATGAILTDLVSRDESGIDAVFARPNTTDQAGREPEIEFPDVIFPTTFATLGTYELLNTERTGDPTVRQQSLNLLAGQYVGPTSTQRLFERMDGQVYYAPEGTEVDWTPPRILDVDANVSGLEVGFSVDVEDLDSGVSRVVVLYRSSQSGNVSDWTAVDLVPLGSGVWAGGGTFDPSVNLPLDYIVQALNGDGVPGIAVFKGDLYQAEVVPEDPNANQPPDVGEITAPTDPLQIGSTVIASAAVTDEKPDEATVIWSWGDGSTTSGTIHEGAATQTHIYDAPGVYQIRLIVVDHAGLVGESSFEFVVVYDPDGGYVTGGGWIESPHGAYLEDPSLTGKATFGFVSRYKKGQSTPDGSTTFKFNVASLDFRSTEYEWLVISGEHRAQYKGRGTINNGGDYRFILTAIDAEQTSSTDTDLFRIKIWWEDGAGEHVVYDNGLGADDNADPTTPIAGGSIVIHSGKKNGPK